MLNIHDIFRETENTKCNVKGVSRFLGVDNEKNAYLIQIDNGFKTKPYSTPFEPLLDSIRIGEVQIVKNFTIKGIPTSEESLNKSELNHYKNNLEMMKPFIIKEELIFDSTKRSIEIKNCAKKFNKSKRSIQRLYYRYLGSGMNIFAFAPRYTSRGGPQISPVRRGRKGGECILPINCFREQLEDGVKRFIMSEKHTIPQAFVLMLKKHFKIKGASEKDKYGNKIPLKKLLVDPQLRPTLNTFKYHYRKHIEKHGKRTKLPKRPRPEKINKVIKGRARDLVLGPGFRFEIDSTGLQIELVSRYGRSLLIGSPTLYLVVDVWCGVITGYVMSLNSAGWPLAAKALKNSFQDKGKVFRRLDLPYTSYDWPCHHLPSRLAGDRGEMKSLKPEILCKPGGINLEIGPKMLPEWRATVESTFNNIKHGDFYNIAGRHPKFPKRGESDGKDQAALTFDELEIIIVEKIMDLNNDEAPKNIVPAQMMEDPNAIPSKIEMYRWGIENRPGYTRKLSDKDVFTFLHTRAIASVTPSGILFKNYTYYSERLNQNGFLVKAANTKRFNIEISYDEHFADVIWFFDPFLEDWIDAHNTHEEIRRKRISFYELDIFQDDLSKRIEALKYENTHVRSIKAKGINKISKVAEKKAKIAKYGKSKSSLKKNITKNRELDIEYENQLGSFETVLSYGFGHTAKNIEKKYQTTDTAPQRESKSSETKPIPITELTKQVWSE